LAFEPVPAAAELNQAAPPPRSRASATPEFLFCPALTGPARPAEAAPEHAVPRSTRLQIAGLGDPLYAPRRTLHTGAALLTEKQQARLEALFAVSEHVEVEATWGIYQGMIAAHREPGKKHGKAMMQAVIDSVASGVPATLTEIRKLGRTLKQRATDILAFFDRPGTSNGPAEAINGRLEHLRGSALGFRNLTNYIARSLLEAGGCRPRLHLRLR
jgi:transposase